MGDFDDRGVVQDAEHGFVLAALDGRREQKALWRFSGVASTMRGLEAKSPWVEHAIGLVENEHLNLREVGGAALHKRPDHVPGSRWRQGPRSSFLICGPVATPPTNIAHGSGACALPMGMHRISDLAGQLAGGGSR